jgi:peptidoglycan hydrolase-like amidase
MFRFLAKITVIIALFFTLCGLSLFIVANFSRAIDPIDDIQNQINEIEHLRQLSIAATTPLENQVNDLEARIKKAQADIATAQEQTKNLAQTIDKEELQLASQYQIFALRVANRYKRQSYNSPLLLLLNSEDAVALTRTLTYRQAAEEQDNKIIHETGAQIKDLESQKQDLEDRQKRLASLTTDLDKQASFFKTQIQGAKAYQADLSGKIAALTAKQQQILDARSGAFTTSVGDVPLADDFNASIAFKPQAPADSFAVFSFGAYTHRKGMSQYGAKARSDAGQSAEDILKAYYPDAQLKKDYGEPDQISVDGFGRMSFEGQYLQGIGEMPSSWSSNALKAQAVAARTFALHFTGNGQRSICANENCQVFYNSKKGGAWESAVNDTRGWVLVDGSGQPISAQYASTHGGYATTSGWDTTDHSGGGDWSSRAWESKANSPWFYKAWYTQAYSTSSAKCGRSHPWLSQAEFSDIINAWIVRNNANGADVSRIQPITINDCHVGGSGGNPYSMDELRNLANNSGGAVTHVDSVTVSNTGEAQTSTVHVQTNRGGLDISGNDFKTTFNLRAPGYLSIPQKSFAFFNVEHKN